MDFSLLLASAIFLIVLLSLIDLGRGLRSMTKLSEIPPIADDAGRRVSVIVAACNEAAHIEPAILTLLRQDYPHLEIIAVNDRSVDDTGLILEKLRQQHPEKLQVIHVENLPPGWMGKNHALKSGAEHARGEYLLFTDADIHMEKSTISRAVGYLRRERLDHISLIFRNVSPGILLNSLILDAGTGLLQCFRPWRARSGSPRYYMGVGGFNMVRRSVYDRIGGFAAIKMHPVDDIMLGKIIKRGGYRQECLLGQDLVSVSWYGSVGQMIDGLIKNVLAVIHYRFFLVPALLAVLFLLHILPLWGLVFFSGIARLLFGLALLMKMTASYLGTRMLGISPWCALGTLISPYLIFYIYVKATWRNARDNGIYWRGTHYSLAELRRNDKVLF